jgi:GT2 family glycosyltransferase
VVQADAEVVVVDNASSDATHDLAGEHRAGYIRLQRRVSYAAAMNEAIARTKGDAVLLLNADCFLAPDFLARARPRLDDDEVGAVAGRLLRVSGPLAEPDAIDAAGMVLDRRRKNTIAGHGLPASALSRPGECFGADGAAALYRREALERCALPPARSGFPEVFDEDMALWATDADLAWRMRLLGWRCAYEPAATGRHVRTYSPSKRAQVAGAHRRLQFRNRYLMWAKNETRAGLLRDLPRVLAYEAAQLGYVLAVERYLLGGYADAWRARDGARRRRAEVQARRAVKRPPFGMLPPS